MSSNQLARGTDDRAFSGFIFESRSGRLVSVLFIFIIFLVLSNVRVSHAQVVAIGSQGFVACSIKQRLEALMNMMKVGETSITAIYYKKLLMQGECVRLRMGEKINITSQSDNPEIIRIIRLSNNKMYYVSRDPLKIEE